MNVNEAIDQYVSSSGYTTLEQAELYQAAIRVLIVLKPMSVSIGGESVSFNSGMLSDELDRVSQYIRSKQLAGSSTGGSDTRVRTYDQSTIRY